MNTFSYRGYWIELSLELIGARYRWIILVEGVLILDVSNSGTACRLARQFVNGLPRRELTNGLRLDLWNGV